MTLAFLMAAWKQVPWYVKWPICLMFLPLQIKDWSTSYVRSEAQAIIRPLETKHDIEMKHMNEKLDSIHGDLRDVRNHLIGTKR